MSIYFLYAWQNNTENKGNNNIITGIKMIEKSKNTTETPQEKIDIRFAGYKTGSNQYNVRHDLHSVSELEDFFAKYQLPFVDDRQEYHLYICQKSLIGEMQSLNVEYYSREVMWKIFEIFKTRPDILEKTKIHLENKEIIYDFDVSFIPHLDIPNDEI